VRPGYAEIEQIIKIPRSDVADVMLVAIAGQEADWRHRYQIVNGRGKGPARGLWQFERGGGVHGVLRHDRTATKARDLCAARGVSPEDRAVWEALEHDDTLAVGFARLLLWSDPRPLPKTEQDAWDAYIRNWRPGKPHRDRWAVNYQPAVAAVDRAAIAPEPEPVPPGAALPDPAGTIVFEHADASAVFRGSIEIGYPHATPDLAEAIRNAVEWMTWPYRSCANWKSLSATRATDALATDTDRHSRHDGRCGRQRNADCFGACAADQRPSHRIGRRRDGIGVVVPGREVGL